MATFRFPRHLLHSMTEPQWLPRSKEEEGSRLDALEREEAAHYERLRRQVLPDAPDPMGIAVVKNDAAAARKIKTAPPVDLAELPPRANFWERYRDAVDELIIKKGE